MIGWMAWRAANAAWRQRGTPGKSWDPQPAASVPALVTVTLMVTVPLITFGIWDHKTAVVIAGIVAGLLLLWFCAVPKSARGAPSAGAILDRYQPQEPPSGADLAQQMADAQLEMDLLLPEPDRILSVPCPECGMPPGMSCQMGVAVPVAVLRDEPLQLCHIARMGDAARAGLVSQTDVESHLVIPGSDKED